jgi:hypothetical protein
VAGGNGSALDLIDPQCLIDPRSPYMVHGAVRRCDCDCGPLRFDALLIQLLEGC